MKFLCLAEPRRYLLDSQPQYVSLVQSYRGTCDFSFETDEFQDISTTACQEEWNERRALEIFPCLCRSVVCYISLRPEPRPRSNAEGHPDRLAKIRQLQ